MRQSKSRVSKEINWKIFRLKGLSCQVKQLKQELLLTPRGQEAATILAEELGAVTERGNLRLEEYRKFSYEEGRVL